MSKINLNINNLEFISSNIKNSVNFLLSNSEQNTIYCSIANKLLILTKELETELRITKNSLNLLNDKSITKQLSNIEKLSSENLINNINYNKDNNTLFNKIHAKIDTINIKNSTSDKQKDLDSLTKLNNICILETKNNHNITLNAKNKLEHSDIIKSGQAKVDYFNSKDNRSFIHCDSPQSKSKVSNFLKSSGFTVRDVKFTKYLICFNVNSTYSKKKVLDLVKQKDKRFSDSNTFFVECFPTDDSKLTNKFVFSVSQLILEQIKQFPFINIGLNKIKIDPFFKLIQCFKCASYGHLSTDCKSSVLYCSICGSKDHQVSECNNKLNVNCVNCIKNNLPSNHSSWSSTCPFRKQYIAKHKLKF